MVLHVIKDNLQLIVLMMFWVIAGMFTGLGVFIFIPITLIILFSKDRFPEIFIGFIFILILSDSLEEPMAFAKSFKNLYILFLFFCFFVAYAKFEIKVNIYRYFIPYFIFGLIGMMFSPVFFTSFQKLLSYILLFIVVPNYVVKCYQQQGAEFFRNLIYFLFSIIVIGFLLRYYNSEIAYSHGGRFRGIFGNPNGLGIFMIMFFILFAIVRKKFDGVFSRWETILILLVSSYLLYKTGSRTALLAVVLFFLFDYIFKYSSFLGFALFLALMISVEFLILYFPKLIIELGMQKSMRMETLDEGSGRLLAWQFAWTNIQDSFFIGRGIGFDENLMRSNKEMLSKAGHEGGVHNTYLIMWLNTGLLGLIAFLRGFFLVFIRCAKRNNYAFPVMFSVLLSINFEPWLSASLNPYTILFLVIITLMFEDIFNPEIEESTEDEEEMEVIPQVG